MPDALHRASEPLRERSDDYTYPGGVPPNNVPASLRVEEGLATPPVPDVSSGEFRDLYLGEFERGLKEVRSRVRPYDQKTLENEAWVVYCMMRAALRSMGFRGGE